VQEFKCWPNNWGLIMITLVLVSFAAGIVVAAALHLGAPIATVRLHNASGKGIASLRLVHEHGLVEFANLAIDATRSVHLYVPGKSSYMITLVFADGQSLKGGASYVEAGYLITETIADSEVKTEYTSLRYQP
jgi:hypothetical protein